jgi:16S rRNA processing protein RimM
MNNQRSTMNQEWIEVGTIIAPQGLKGELRVYSNSDFPERFLQPGIRWLQNPEWEEETIEVELLSGRYIPNKNLYAIFLEGIVDRDEAEKLRGYKILVEPSDRPILEPEEYHVGDLLDLEVYHQATGENIGKVIDIFSTGHDLLEVLLHKQPIREIKPVPDLSQISRKSKRRPHKPKTIKPATVLIPFVKDIVPVVDLDRNRIEITPPPGLLEID